MSTGTFSGIGEKSSSKVIHPPGGGGNNIFGEPYDESKDYSLVEKKRKERLAQQDKMLAEEKKQASENRTSNNSTDEKSAPQQQMPLHAKAPQTDTQGNIFGGSTQPAAGSKQKGEEFPAYDVKVYAAQMAPQRRNITQVSTHNPITGEAYAGFEDNDVTSRSQKGKRHQNLGIEASPEAVYHPITGQLLSGSEDEPTATRNSSKVINPPGGKASGLW